MSGVADSQLAVDRVSVSRGGRVVLRDLSISVPPGQVTAMLGPNGAGKSTLSLAIAGAVRPTAGSISIGDVTISGKRPDVIRKAGVAVVPEGRRLLGDLSVEDNLRTATYAMSKRQAAEGIDRSLEMFPELKKRWRSPSRLLSGGEQQMVALAQALASKPKILVIDEMSLGLAPIVVSRLEPAIAEVAEAGIGVLLIEQFAHIALSLSKKVYILYQGQVSFKGETAELASRPELLDAAYRLGADSADGAAATIRR